MTATPNTWRPFCPDHAPPDVAALAAEAGEALPSTKPTLALAARLPGLGGRWARAAAAAFDRGPHLTGPRDAERFIDEAEELPPAAAVLAAFLAAWRAPAGDGHRGVLRAAWPAVLGVLSLAQTRRILDALEAERERADKQFYGGMPTESLEAAYAGGPVDGLFDRVFASASATAQAALRGRMILISPAATALRLVVGDKVAPPEAGLPFSSDKPAAEALAMMPRAYIDRGVAVPAALLAVGRCLRRARAAADTLPDPDRDTPAALRPPLRHPRPNPRAS